MDERKHNLITRRRAIISLATLTAGTLIKPTSLFATEPVKKKVRFAVLGDWGTGDDDQYGLGQQMLNHHKQTSLDFVLGAGDNIYPNGSGRYFKKKFEDPFAGLLKENVRFYTVLGNHDVEQGRQDQRDYPLFNMAGNYYYSLSQGNGLVELFMLDSTDYDDTQAAWFENALRTSKARWKMVVLHHPLYSSGKKHGSNGKLRRRIEPLLTKYGVKAVFAGHDHMYERTHPQNGVQHFVTGAGGKTRRGGVDLSSPVRAASYDSDNHFMIIEVDGKKVEFKAVCETGTVVDSGVIL